MDESVKKRLREISNKHQSCILFDEPLSKYSTLATGGGAAVMYKAASLEEIREVRQCITETGTKTVLIGRCSNVLFPDTGIDGVVLNLSNGCFKDISFEENKVTSASGVFLGTLIKECCKRGLSGLEGLIGIPAAVGGAIKNNASYLSAISEYLEEISIMDLKGEISRIARKDINFGYRCTSLNNHGIILQAVFRLEKTAEEVINKRIREFLAAKKEKQPLNEKTLGCVFKNPEKEDFSAGKLIEMAGMKGKRRGGAEVSEKHANFIINTGRAVSADYIKLMEDVQEAVKEKFSIYLEPEIEIIV